MPGPEKVTVRHPRPGRLGREEQPRDLCEERPRHRLQERQDPPRHAGVRGREGWWPVLQCNKRLGLGSPRVSSEARG